jgi:acetyltransferase-like isoleucine patch superfamily enzyme
MNNILLLDAGDVNILSIVETLYKKGFIIHAFCTNKLTYGNHTRFMRNNQIDYTGYLTIFNNCEILNGVQILTHHHDIEEYNRIGINKTIYQNELIINEFTDIGTNAVSFFPPATTIGKYARIGADAVVTKDVPDYAVVGGIPAKNYSLFK